MNQVRILAEDVSTVDLQAVNMLREHGYEVREIINNKALPQSEIYDFIKDAHAVIAGSEKYDRSLLERLPNLKVIARRGVGVDNIDISYAEQRGIRVTRTVGAVEKSVAELVIAYILNFARLLPQQDKFMKEGKWHRLLSEGAYGKTLGLVGFGGVGQEVARYAKAIGMRVVYYSRSRHQEEEHLTGAQYCPLDELLKKSDYVSLHCSLNAQTRGMIAWEQLKKMKPVAVLINTSRGSVVCEKDLARALQEKVIRGAALDVYEEEPMNHKWFEKNSNVILTPHTATFTRETFIHMNNMAAESIIHWLG